MSSDWPTDNGMIATILEEAKYIKTNGLEVDIQKWSKMSSWTVKQAVYIFHGLDPARGLQSENLKPYPIYKSILDAYDIMMNFASDNKIPHEGDPMLFFDWAELVGITVSEELKNAVLEEGCKRDMFELEKQYRIEDTMAHLKRGERDKQVASEKELTERVVQKFAPKFAFTPKATTYGYFPALEEVLYESCQAGEPIPSPEDAYDRIVDKKPKLVTFDTQSRTLTYVDRYGDKSREVKLAAIKKAIDKRTKGI